MELKFETPRDTLDIPVRDSVLVVDLAMLSPKIIAALFAYGLAQKLGDAGSGAKAAVTEGMAQADVKPFTESEVGKRKIAEAAIGMAQKALDALYEDQWSVRGGGTVRVPADPVTALALRTAKEVILTLLKAKTGKAKMADIGATDAGKTFLDVADDKATWNDEAVLAWVDKQAASGKRDFRAEAKAVLDGAEDDLAL